MSVTKLFRQLTRTCGARVEATLVDESGGYSIQVRVIRKQALVVDSEERCCR